MVFKAPIKEKKSVVVNGIDLLENVPPRTENEVRNISYYLDRPWKSETFTFQLWASGLKASSIPRPFSFCDKYHK